jgi:hypothetical protein
MAGGQIEVDAEHILIAVLKYNEVKQTWPNICSNAFLA